MGEVKPNQNRIKEAQQDLFADRTGTHWMATGQTECEQCGLKS